MAGLPQDRPVPGAPLLDPLGTGAPPILPVAPPPLPSGPPTAGLVGGGAPLAGLPQGPPAPGAGPQGYQYGPTGDPVPWPDSWFATPEGQPPAEVQGHDVPVVENDQAQAAAPQPPAEQPPAAPGALEQAGPQGMAALDQARKDGHLDTNYAEAEPAKSTGDPYLDMLDQTGDVKARAAVQKAQADKDENSYLRAQGMKIAQDWQTRQDAADAAYAKVYNETKAKRAQLDAEAIKIANTKTDPSRVWNNMSFGAQLFVGITAALSGATTRSVQTGQNPVIDAMSAAVDRDLKAQADDLANRWKGVTVRQGLLADGLAAGHDMLDIQYKANKVASETAANYAKAYAMKFNNPRIDADTATFLADLQQKDATDGMNYETAKHKAAFDEQERRAQVGIAGGHLALASRHENWEEGNAEAERQNRLELAGLKGGAAQAKAAAAERHSLLLDPEGKPIPLNDGTGEVVTANDPKEVGKEREAQAADWNYYTQLKQYKAAVEKGQTQFGGLGGLIGQSDEMSRLKHMHSNLILSYNKMHAISRLSEHDISLVGGDIIPAPSTWTKHTNPLPGIDQAVDTFRDVKNRQMQTVYGVQDNDWIGSWEKTHPQHNVKVGATDSDDRHTWDETDVPTDKTGAIIGEPGDPSKRAPEGLPSAEQRNAPTGFDDVPTGEPYRPLGNYDRHKKRP